MTVSISLFIRVLGLVCLLLASVGVNAPRVQLGWFGLFLIFLGGLA